LLAEPEAILLDEPFSKLDDDLRDSIKEFVFEHIGSVNIPALLVTHDRRDSADGTFIELR
jgi:putative thiamine transport system ATP-binding protein